MKKILLSLFILSFTFQTKAQEFGYKWVWFTEVSPNASLAPALHERSDFSRNFSWRNRVGIRVGENTIIGLMGSFRHYDYQETLTFYEEHSFSDGDLAHEYRFQSRNNLLGTGFFATQLYPINKKLELTLNFYSTLEQGRGNHDRYWQRLYATDPTILLDWIRPVEPESREFREKNLVSGLELGGIYYLRQNLGLQGSVRLVQLEWYRLRESPARPFEENPKHEIMVSQEGWRYFHLGKQPVANLGLVYHFGDPR